MYNISNYYEDVTKEYINYRDKLHNRVDVSNEYMSYLLLMLHKMALDESILEYSLHYDSITILEVLDTMSELKVINECNPLEVIKPYDRLSKSLLILYVLEHDKTLEDKAINYLLTELYKIFIDVNPNAKELKSVLNELNDGEQDEYLRMLKEMRVYESTKVDYLFFGNSLIKAWKGEVEDSFKDETDLYGLLSAKYENTIIAEDKDTGVVFRLATPIAVTNSYKGSDYCGLTVFDNTSKGEIINCYSDKPATVSDNFPITSDEIFKCGSLLDAIKNNLSKSTLSNCIEFKEVDKDDVLQIYARKCEDENSLPTEYLLLTYDWIKLK